MKLHMRWKVLTLFLMISALGTLAACGAGGQEEALSENVLIYANLSESGPDREAIDEFNKTHTDVQIEVRDYLDAEGNGDKTRLLAEMIAGKGPDIIDMRSDLSRVFSPYVKKNAALLMPRQNFCRIN